MVMVRHSEVVNTLYLLSRFLGDAHAELFPLHRESKTVQGLLQYSINFVHALGGLWWAEAEYIDKYETRVLDALELGAVNLGFAVYTYDLIHPGEQPIVEWQHCARKARSLAAQLREAKQVAG